MVCCSDFTEATISFSFAKWIHAFMPHVPSIISISIHFPTEYDYDCYAPNCSLIVLLHGREIPIENGTSVDTIGLHIAHQYLNQYSQMYGQSIEVVMALEITESETLNNTVSTRLVLVATFSGQSD